MRFPQVGGGASLAELVAGLAEKQAGNVSGTLRERFMFSYVRGGGTCLVPDCLALNNSEGTASR